jgi:Predicted membrane protein
MYYISSFFVYSFIGFLFENFVSIFTNNPFNSGILYGPITPIYGIGAITIIIISKYLFYNLHMPRWIETIIIFFILIFILTIIEWLGGILIEKIFGIVFWDYSNYNYNIGHYIALEISIIWGLLSIFLIYIIKPLINPIVKNIPRIVNLIFIGIFMIDIFFSVFHLKNIL